MNVILRQFSDGELPVIVVGRAIIWQFIGLTHSPPTTRKVVVGGGLSAAIDRFLPPLISIRVDGGCFSLSQHTANGAESAHPRKSFVIVGVELFTLFSCFPFPVDLFSVRHFTRALPAVYFGNGDLNVRHECSEN